MNRPNKGTGTRWAPGSRSSWPKLASANGASVARSPSHALVKKRIHPLTAPRAMSLQESRGATAGQAYAPGL
jgi:hypothetical protein